MPNAAEPVPTPPERAVRPFAFLGPGGGSGHYSDGAAHHLGAVCDDGETRLYVDGALVKTSTDEEPQP